MLFIDLLFFNQNGNITSKEEIDRILASEKVEKVKVKRLAMHFVNILSLKSPN